MLAGLASFYPVDSTALAAIDAHIHRLMDAHHDPNDAGVESSRLHYELVDLCVGVVIDSIPASSDHIAVAHELITLFFP
ncbi:hypothetical protein ACIG56_32960 [Nocardia fusca]|uniref:hypothetical protein n=1 Tax=Nocardia fusca TaxID=941183 RepID=UPI0037C9C104